MKKLGVILLSIFLLNFSYSNAYNSDPEIFVKELVDDALQKLSDKNINESEKVSFIEKIALENVDLNALSLYTLGELRKSTNKEKLAEYQSIFEKYFLKSLTSRLKDYSSGTFEIISSDKKSASYTIVKSKIPKNEKKPEIKIDWRIYTKNADKPLIRDLIVEGLSLARTQKEEFSSIINSNDGKIEALLKNLSDFSAK